MGYAGLAPQLAGLYQINLTVLVGVTAGDNNLEYCRPRCLFFRVPHSDCRRPQFLAFNSPSPSASIIAATSAARTRISCFMRSGVARSSKA